MASSSSLPSDSPESSIACASESPCSPYFNSSPSASGSTIDSTRNMSIGPTATVTHQPTNRVELPADVIMLILHHAHADISEEFTMGLSLARSREETTSHDSGHGKGPVGKCLTSWPFPATQVTHMWRATALAMPELWYELEIRPDSPELSHPRRIEKFLEMRQGRGLRVVLVGAPGVGNDNVALDETENHWSEEVWAKKTEKLIRDPTFLASTANWKLACVVLYPLHLQQLFLHSQCFRDLEALKITITSPCSPERAVIPKERVTFPALRYLSLSAQEGDIAGQLLKDIDAPYLTELYICMRQGPDEDGMLMLGEGLVFPHPVPPMFADGGCFPHFWLSYSPPLHYLACIGTQLTYLSIVRTELPIELGLVETVLRHTPNLISLTLGTTRRLPPSEDRPNYMFWPLDDFTRTCFPVPSIDEGVFVDLLPPAVAVDLLPRLEVLRLVMFGEWVFAFLPEFLASKRIHVPMVHRGAIFQFLKMRVHALRGGLDGIGEVWGALWKVPSQPSPDFWELESEIPWGTPLEGSRFKRLELFVTHEAAHYAPELDIMQKAMLGEDFEWVLHVMGEPNFDESEKHGEWCECGMDWDSEEETDPKAEDSQQS